MIQANKYEDSSLPLLCVGQLGWDITTINDTQNISFGGTVLHFATAAAILGVKFDLVSYVNKTKWQKVLDRMSAHGMGVKNIIDFEQDIEFVMFYDEQLNFDERKFEMNISSDEPDIQQHLRTFLSRGQFIHVCQTTPEDDEKYYSLAKSKNAVLSLQIHINNLLNNVDVYLNALQYARYVFMNESEALFLTKSVEISHAMSKLTDNFSCDFYITSSNGVTFINREHRYFCPSVATSVIDPTGAGDVFAGACTAGRILSGYHDVAVRLGILFSTIKLGAISSTSLFHILEHDTIE